MTSYTLRVTIPSDDWSVDMDAAIAAAVGRRGNFSGMGNGVRDYGWVMGRERALRVADESREAVLLACPRAAIFVQEPHSDD